MCGCKVRKPKTTLVFVVFPNTTEATEDKCAAFNVGAEQKKRKHSSCETKKKKKKIWLIVWRDWNRTALNRLCLLETKTNRRQKESQSRFLWREKETCLFLCKPKLYLTKAKRFLLTPTFLWDESVPASQETLVSLDVEISQNSGPLNGQRSPDWRFGEKIREPPASGCRFIQEAARATERRRRAVSLLRTTFLRMWPLAALTG